MGLKIGVVGSISFANAFIPLFQAHPLIEEVAVAELVAEKRNIIAERYSLKRVYSSLEEMLSSDMDAVALITQRHLHGPQTLQALRAGKHVFCAVPMAQSLDEIEAIIEELKRSGLIYMTAETSYYYPTTVFCREQHKRGLFGHIVYGEAGYLHDMTHGFYEAFQNSGGMDWKRFAGFPPMFYATHSTSMIVSVTGATPTRVACLGYRDRHEDGIFREGANIWNNAFSNETALLRMSDGSTVRINEFRRVGWTGETNNSVHMSLFGTQGSYEEQANAKVWTGLRKEDIRDLKEELRPRDVPVPGVDPQEGSLFRLVSPVHPVERLPREFAGKENGHYGSHYFLVDDFVKAVAFNKLPPNHAWAAARYCAPGLVAHESAKRDGEWLGVPEFGEPPSYWEPL